MSLSKLASWTNKTVNNNFTSHSSNNFCTFTYNEYFLCSQFMGKNPSTICSI